jgi:asparagine synthase (glutamine-hydrolysing)
VDWGFIAQRVASASHASQAAVQSSSQRTAIKRISIVQPGEQVEVHRGAITRSLAWDPLQIARAEPIQDARQGAEQLRDAAKACVHAWATCYRGVLHSLSGGLDSSIVLGCLRDAQHSPSITCLNYHSANAGGDERYFARLAANHAHCPLLEWERDNAMPLEDLSAMERSAAPVNYLNWLQVSRREARLAREISADAVFSGDGGDELFCRNQGILGAADYLRSKGVNRHFIEVALDTAHVENCSLWHVIREAFKQRRAPGDLPAGKRLHVTALCAGYDYVDPLRSSDYPDRVQPLLSQPLIELCLRIPTYLLTSKGWDRALAREAFSEDVPREILRRRTKVSMNENILDVLKRNIAAARELLLDGELVANGMIDRAKMENALSDDACHDKMLAHGVFELLSTEAWLRTWKSPRSVSVAH